MTRIRPVLPLAILAGALLFPLSAEALSPFARDRDALITSVDRNSATLTVAIEDESRLRSFEWNKATDFFRDGKITGAEALTSGVAVRIRYHAPFFGKPFVCKVTLLERPASTTKTTTLK